MAHVQNRQPQHQGVINTSPTQFQAGGVSHTIITGPPIADPFRLRKYQISGWVQIALGVMAILFQLIDIAVAKVLWRQFINFVKLRGPADITWVSLSLEIDGYSYENTFQEDIYGESFTIAYVSTGVWTGLLFILNGAIGASMTEKRKQNRRSLAHAYMWLSLLMSSLIAPGLIAAALTELAMSCAISVREAHTSVRPVVPGFLVMVGIAELIAAMYAGCLSRCGYMLPASENQWPTQNNVLIMGPQATFSTQYARFPQQSIHDTPPPYSSEFEEQYQAIPTNTNSGSHRKSGEDNTWM